MKNYEEVAESVFKRSEEMIALNKRRRREMMKNIGAAAGCLAVAGAVGIGVWKNAGSPGLQVIDDNANAIQSAGQFANDGIDHSGESDTVSVTDHVVEGDGIVGVIPDLDPPEYPTLDDITDSVGVLGNDTPGNTDSGGAADGTVGVIPPSSDIPALPAGAPASSSNSNEGPCIETDDIKSILSSTHTNPAIVWGDPPTVSNVIPPNVTTVIEEYGAAGAIPDAPENGAFLLSDALKGAMDKYGYSDENGDIQYRVVVNYYDNGEPVDISSSAIREDEWNRLCGHGYQCHFETHTKNFGKTIEHHLCLMLTRGQLESFAPCDSYGCTICLYGEKSCILDDNTSDSVQPTQVNSSHHHEHLDGDHC